MRLMTDAIIEALHRAPLHSLPSAFEPPTIRISPVGWKVLRGEVMQCNPALTLPLHPGLTSLFHGHPIELDQRLLGSHVELWVKLGPAAG